MSEFDDVTSATFTCDDTFVKLKYHGDYTRYTIGRNDDPRELITDREEFSRRIRGMHTGFASVYLKRIATAPEHVVRKHGVYECWHDGDDNVRTGSECERRWHTIATHYGGVDMWWQLRELFGNYYQ